MLLTSPLTMNMSCAMEQNSAVANARKNSIKIQIMILAAHGQAQIWWDWQPRMHVLIFTMTLSTINYGKPTKGWRYDKNTMSRLIAEGRIIWPDTPNGRPRKKQYLADLAGLYTGYSSIIGENFYTRTGSNEQLQIWGDIRFDFPKNSGLLQELIEQACDENDIILDSFAGSGTTAHAVLNRCSPTIPSVAGARRA